MNNEDLPTTDQRPTDLPGRKKNLNGHNFGCAQDRFVIFGSKYGSRGRPIQRVI